MWPFRKKKRKNEIWYGSITIDFYDRSVDIDFDLPKGKRKPNNFYKYFGVAMSMLNNGTLTEAIADKIAKVVADSENYKEVMNSWIAHKQSDMIMKSQAYNNEDDLVMPATKVFDINEKSANDR